MNVVLKPSKVIKVRSAQHTSVLQGYRSRNQNAKHTTVGPARSGRVVNMLVTEVNDIQYGESVGALDTIDESAMLSQSTFPIKEEKLIELTKAFLAANNGVDAPDTVAEDFKFIAPVVGPLGKQEFIKAFGSFNLKEAFPDFKTNAHHFRVDPFEPNRVWFTTRGMGTHTGTIGNFNVPATNIKVVTPPQALSCKFNESGECDQLTVGYVMDKNQGNTGGLGGVFGILYAIGKPLPFPECKPWTPSWQFKAFQVFSRIAQQVLAFFKGNSKSD